MNWPGLGGLLLLAPLHRPHSLKAEQRCLVAEVMDTVTAAYDCVGFRNPQACAFDSVDPPCAHWVSEGLSKGGGSLGRHWGTSVSFHAIAVSSQKGTPSWPFSCLDKSLPNTIVECPYWLGRG